MNRQTMITELIEHELDYLVNNYDRHTLSEVAEFFARGGFSDYSDAKLEKQYNTIFGEITHE